MAATTTSSNPRRLAAGLLLVGLLASSAASAKLLYRWVNEEGNTETSHSIPSEVVHLGYEVLDGRSMRVIDRVAPQMSQAEYEALKEREAAIAACEKALDRVNFLYERSSDIDKAEARALRNLEGRIQSAQQNLTNARKYRETLEARAARAERQGNNVSREDLASLEASNRQIATIEREIQQREAEKGKTRVEFDQERLLFGNQSCEGTALAYR